MQKSRFVTSVVMRSMNIKTTKNGDITEDDLRGLEKDVQTLTDNSIKEVDKIAADKEKELLKFNKIIKTEGRIIPLPLFLFIFLYLKIKKEKIIQFLNKKTMIS